MSSMDKHDLKKHITKMCMIVIAILLGLILVVNVIGGMGEEEAERVGFIIPGDKNQIGYMSEHYCGIFNACKGLGLELSIVENVEDNNSGACIEAVDCLVEEGVKVIILGSYGYQAEMMDYMDNYPDVSFYCSSDTVNGSNYSFFFPRMYQARYLAGIVAGATTKTGNIGYIAAMDNCEVNRGINAFTLGVRSVNKDANVYVYWTGSWDDEATESTHARELIENVGIDVISYHQNKPYVIDVAEEYGIYSIGYNVATNGYSENVLASVRANWSMIYKEILQDNFQNGGATRSQFWIGMEDNAVYLSNYSPLLSEDVMELVENSENKIRRGMDVFSGRIVDSNMQVRCNDGEIMSDKTLMTDMNWFVDGVVIYE